MPNLDPPPVALTANYDGGTGMMTIVFDRDLLMQPLALGNWPFTLQDMSVTFPSEAQVEAGRPNQVLLTFHSGLLPDHISYLATPADVVGAGPNGSAATPFELFFV